MKKDKNIIEITTPSGFSCTIDRDKFDDWDYIEMLANSDNDQLTEHKMCLFVVNKVMLPEDATKLKEMCKNPDGVVPWSKMHSIILEIMNAIGEQVKN